MSEFIGIEHIHHKPNADWLKIRLPEAYLGGREWKNFVEFYEALGASEARATATKREAHGGRNGAPQDYEDIMLMIWYVVSKGLTLPPRWRHWEVTEEYHPDRIDPSTSQVAKEVCERLLPHLINPDQLSKFAKDVGAKRTTTPAFWQCTQLELGLGNFVEREERLPTKNELYQECQRHEAAGRCGEYIPKSKLSGPPKHGTKIEGGIAFSLMHLPDVGGRPEVYKTLICPKDKWGEEWKRKANAPRLLKKLGLQGLPNSPPRHR